MESRQKSSKSKGSEITGDVQLQFALADPANQSNPQEILERFMAFVALSNPSPGADEYDDNRGSKAGSRGSDENNDDEEDDEEADLETSDETDDPIKSGGTEKRKKKLRLARLKKKTKARAYEFSGGTDVVGIVFLDIVKITDLPPERNSRYFPPFDLPIPNFNQSREHPSIWIPLWSLHSAEKHIGLESFVIT